MPSALGFEGRFDEAFAESDRARKLDPLSLIISADYAALLYFSRQYDRSIEEFRRVLEMEPNFPRAYIVIFPLVEKGLFAEALADVDKWKRVVDSPWPLSVQVYVYARSGQIDQARTTLQKLQHMDQRQFIDPAAILMAHVGMDDKDETFAWLQKCYDARSPLTTLKVDPMYRSPALRSALSEVSARRPLSTIEFALPDIEFQIDVENRGLSLPIILR